MTSATSAPRRWSFATINHGRATCCKGFNESVDEPAMIECKPAKRGQRSTGHKKYRLRIEIGYWESNERPCTLEHSALFYETGA